jgi:hypothetical protein
MDWKPQENLSKEPVINALLNIALEISVLTEAVRSVSFLRDDLKKVVEGLDRVKESIEAHGEILKEVSEVLEENLEDIRKSATSIDKTLYRRP